MTDKKNVLNQIRYITKALVNNSIAIDQNFPVEKGNEIIWEKYQNIAFTLKNEEYKEIYNSCLKAQDYNFLLLDGAIIQLKYLFERNSIKQHVLSYYPNPSVENYQETPKDYENIHFGNEPFSTISSKEIVSFPLRFDFSDVFTAIHHPYSHATLGNYASCRIPINKPISPFNFMNFILRNFYNLKFIECEAQLNFDCKINLKNTISILEKKILHFNIE